MDLLSRISCNSDTVDKIRYTPLGPSDWFKLLFHLYNRHKNKTVQKRHSVR